MSKDCTKRSTALASAKNYLDSEGIIRIKTVGGFHDINIIKGQEERFAETAKYMREEGFKKYGIDAVWVTKNGTAVKFNKRAFKAVDMLNGHTYVNHIDESHYLKQAITRRNSELMQQFEDEKKQQQHIDAMQLLIDAQIDFHGDNNILYDDDAFDIGDNFNFNETAVPEASGLKKLIILKEKLLANAKHQLIKVNSLIGPARGDAAEYKRLINESIRLKEYIEGNPEKEIQGLEKEIEEMLTISIRTPAMIAPYIEKELTRLEKLVKSESPEDLKEARDIIQFIEAMNNFKLEDANRHPLFDKSEMFNEHGEFILTRAMEEPFNEWALRARAFGNELLSQEQRKIEEVFNNNATIQRMFEGKVFDYDEIVLAGVGLQDASWIDMMVMDITAGIFTQNGMLAQVARKVVEDEFNVALAWTKGIEKRLDDIRDDVEEEIAKLENGKYKLSSLGILGVKGVSFDWIRQKYKNGLTTKNMATKYAPEWFDALSEMRNKFRAKVKVAEDYINDSIRDIEMQQAHDERNAWLNKNTKVINPALLSAIRNSVAFSEFSEHFTGTEADVTAHEAEIKAIVGERHFNKLVEEQERLLEEYKVQRQSYIDDAMYREGVTSMNATIAARLRIWEAQNNPFQSTAYLATGQPYRGSLFGEYHSQLKYNVYTPLREVDGKPSEYFDENYEKVENNDTLMKFYDICYEALTNIKEQFDAETQKSMLDSTVPFEKTSLGEFLLKDKNITVFQFLSEAFRRMLDALKNIAGARIQDQMSFAKVNVITGVPEYTVNDSFIKQGKNKIDQNFDINKARFMQDFKAILGTALTKFGYDTHITLTEENADAMATILSPYLPGGITGARLLEKYNDKIPAGKILLAHAEHLVAQEQSFDLPRIIKTYSNLASQYAARQNLLPLVELIKRHYEGIKNPATQNTGQPVTNAALNGEMRPEGLRTQANAQFNNWFQRVVLGDGNLKKHYGFLKGPVDLPDGTEQDRLTRFIGKFTKGRQFDGKVFNREEKALEKRINDLLATETDKDAIKSLEDMKQRLGRDMSLSGLMENILNYLRFKGLGFNLNSGITNIAEGQIANQINAASGLWFPSEYIDTISLTEMIYSDSTRRFNGKGIEKVRRAQLMMEIWDVLQDSKNELQKGSAKSGISGVNKFNPYYVQSKTESYNQIPLLVAVLRDTKLKDKDGNESSVWDALEMNGEHGLKLKNEFRVGPTGEKNIQNWEMTTGEDYLNFKSRLSGIIKNTHGDFDRLSGMMAKSYHTGVAFMMFRTWLPREIYKRFATEQNDIITGVKGFKGRYRSSTAATAFMLGAGVGILPMGIAGAVGVGAISAVVGRMFGSNNTLSFISELLLNTQILTRKMIGMPVNAASSLIGKGNIIETDAAKIAGDKFNVTEEFTAVDFANWKANLQEVALLYMWIGLLLLAKGFSWDDDDKESDKRRQAHNLMANRLIQLSSSITQYVNPMEMWKTITNVSVIKLVTDSYKCLTDLDKLLKGQDEITEGADVGDSRFAKQFGKTFLPSIIANPFSLGFGPQTERQFQPTEVDSWFYNAEHDAKIELKQIKADLKGELKDTVDEELLNKEIAKRVGRKKKGQSYVEFLEQVKSTQKE